MGLWLFKSDPEVYAWNDLVRAKKEIWDGVSNNLALKYLRSVKKGDLIFIYHSGDEKSVVGVARAMSDSFPDPSQKNERLAVVDIEPDQAFDHAVTLAEIKSNSKLKSWELVRLPRLSVMPVTESMWQEIIRLSQKSQKVPQKVPGT